MRMYELLAEKTATPGDDEIAMAQQIGRMVSKHVTMPDGLPVTISYHFAQRVLERNIIPRMAVMMLVLASLRHRNRLRDMKEGQRVLIRNADGAGIILARNTAQPGWVLLTMDPTLTNVGRVTPELPVNVGQVTRRNETKR